MALSGPVSGASGRLSGTGRGPAPGCPWPSVGPLPARRARPACLLLGLLPWGFRGAAWRQAPRASSSGLPLPQGPSRNLLLNGKSYPTKVRLIRGGSLPPVKRRRMNWIDAPDDVFYMATEETRWGPPQGWQRGGPRGASLEARGAGGLCSLVTCWRRCVHRKIRKLLSSSETKRAARRPYKPIALRQSQALPLRPPPPAPVNDEPIVIED